MRSARDLKHVALLLPVFLVSTTFVSIVTRIFFEVLINTQTLRFSKLSKFLLAIIICEIYIAKLRIISNKQKLLTISLWALDTNTNETKNKFQRYISFIVELFGRQKKAIIKEAYAYDKKKFETNVLNTKINLNKSRTRCFYFLISCLIITA